MFSPQMGRSAGSARTLSQAASANHQPRNSAGNAGIYSQAGSANPLPHMLGRNTGSAGTPPQADQSLGPSKGASGTTVGDAISSPDNTTCITGEQGQRPGGQVPWLPQLGQTQLIPSRGSPYSQRETP